MKQSKIDSILKVMPGSVVETDTAMRGTITISLFRMDGDAKNDAAICVFIESSRHANVQALASVLGTRKTPAEKAVEWGNSVMAAAGLQPADDEHAEFVEFSLDEHGALRCRARDTGNVRTTVNGHDFDPTRPPQDTDDTQHQSAGFIIDDCDINTIPDGEE